MPYGTTSAATLTITGASGALEAKTIYFPSLSGAGLVTTPPQYYWVRTGGVYCVVWTGTYLVCTNMQVRSATTSYAGVVQLTDSTTSTSTTTAATANSVRLAALSGGKKYADIVIGTMSVGHVEADCDYLCNGANDADIIQDAISLLSGIGGRILLLGGEYWMDRPLELYGEKLCLRGRGLAQSCFAPLMGYIFMTRMPPLCGTCSYPQRTVTAYMHGTAVRWRCPG